MEIFGIVMGVLGLIAGVVGIVYAVKATHRCNSIEYTITEQERTTQKLLEGAKQEGDIVETNDDILAEALTSLDTQKGNIRAILERADAIIRENALTIRVTDTGDWTNVYIESAKNTHEEYMQDVWARLLIEERSTPHSFGYKTLDVLRALSGNIYRLFESVAGAAINDAIIATPTGDIGPFKWSDMLTLSEYGLINLSPSLSYFDLEDGYLRFPLGKDYCIKLRSDDAKKRVHYRCYCLTNAGRELGRLIKGQDSEEYYIAFARELRRELAKQGVTAELHRYTGKTLSGIRETVYISLS